MDIVKRMLVALRVSEPAQVVYLSLLKYGPTSARLIAERVAMTRPSVYDQLKILMNLGLVIERATDGKAEFAIHDVADLERLMEREEKRLADLRTSFSTERERLIKRTYSVEPKIRFVTGRAAILQAMHDMLWDESVTIQAVWPYESMLETLGANELKAFNEKRIRNGLKLQTIWPSRRKKSSHIFETADWGVERRYAPAGFEPDMGYALYDDKVLFISSAKEIFGFIVKSTEFAELMGMQFDLLWKASKKTAA